MYFQRMVNICYCLLFWRYFWTPTTNINHNSGTIKPWLRQETWKLRNDLNCFITIFVMFVTFLVFEDSQNSFLCGPPFGPFSSVNYPNFEQNPSIWTAHHTFLESKHLRLLKIPITFFRSGESKKSCQLIGYM